MATVSVGEEEGDNLIKNEISSSPASASGYTNGHHQHGKQPRRWHDESTRSRTNAKQSQLFLAFIFSFTLIVIAVIMIFFNEGSMLGLQHETIGRHGNSDERLPVGEIPAHDLIDNVVQGDAGDGIEIESDPECKNRRSERLGRGGAQAVQYIHIPKAGGTTIQEGLMKWGNHAGLHLFIHDGDHDKEWECPRTRVKRGVVMGHRGFGFCKGFVEMNKKPMYIVTLREPVSKFISEFDYFMQFNAGEFEKYRRVWGDRKLDDIVIEYNNTLHMGLDKNDPKLRWPHAFVGLSKQQTSFMCGYDCIGFRGRNIPDDEKLQLALENLKKCDVVTIMEELDEFIPQLRMHVNWVPENIQHFPNENHHHGEHSVLSEKAKEIVRGWARIDMKLYEEAVKIHKQKTATAHRCLKIDETDDETDDEEDDEEDNKVDDDKDADDEQEEEEEDDDDENR